MAAPPPPAFTSFSGTTTTDPPLFAPRSPIPAALTPFTSPLRTYLQSHPGLSGIATGALVLNPATSKLLLLQRAPHDSMPLRWEVPGGACDASDPSILAGCARELYEEAGLTASAIVRVVSRPARGAADPAGLEERLGSTGGDVFFTRRGLLMCKFSFLVEVDVAGEDPDADLEALVRLDPNEHVDFVWVDEQEAREKKVQGRELVYTTRHQEEIIIEAFRIWREELGHGQS